MLAIDYPSLYQLASERQQEYRNASPFSHTVIDSLLPDPLLESVELAFPSPGDCANWRQIQVRRPNGDMQLGKLGLSRDRDFPAPIRQLIWELNSAPFLLFLEQLTGIQNLIPDPRLRGGGLHQVLPGGLLGIHADFTQHGMYAISRRINLLIFLNKDWEDSYEGHLELWTKDMVRCEKRLRPQFGRCVVFNTDVDSYHGHPEPLNCPHDRSRKSIALYYYTNGRDDREVPATSATDWQSTSSAEKPIPQ